MTTCDFGGCKCEAAWVATRLWGKGGTIRTCDEHRPGAKAKPAKPGERVWYRVEPIDAEMTDDELERLTQRCIDGDPTAGAEYDRLNRRATGGRR